MIDLMPALALHSAKRRLTMKPTLRFAPLLAIEPPQLLMQELDRAARQDA